MAKKMKAAFWICSKTDPLVIQFSVLATALVIMMFARVKRRVIADNFKSMGLKPQLKSTFRVFYNMVFNIVVFLRSLEKGMDEIAMRTSFVGIKNLKKISTKKSVIMVTCHLGLWDLAARYLGFFGIEVIAVAEYKNVSHFHYELMKRVRSSSSVQILPLENDTTPIKLAKFAKRNKGAVALVGDRDISGTGKETVFFGRKARLPLGPSLLAARLDIPVVIGYFVRSKAWNYRAYTSEPIYLPKGCCDMKKKTEMYFDGIKNAMEKIIAEYPDQWIMFHPPWIK
ncbi:lysophospholipid acyltransferase family protein [candidate division WOR-3 bacterium]|nr:lysophospholipid acyltransferase family protein [candidate division WOR-3 bacterium]